MSDEDKARAEWRERFKRRVKTMEQLLARAPKDTTPTPRPVDEDDDNAEAWADAAAYPGWPD